MEYEIFRRIEELGCKICVKVKGEKKKEKEQILTMYIYNRITQLFE